MKPLAVLSDIHGNLPALEAVAGDLARRGIADVLTLGDHVSGPLWPGETADFLMRSPWRHLAGNHERQLFLPALGASDRFAKDRLRPDQLAWLAALPARRELDGGVLAFHGAPGDDKEYLLEQIGGGHVHLAGPAEIRRRLRGETAPLLLCGHTHVPRIVALDGALIVNPGSVGCPAYDDDQPEPHVVETGSPRAAYAIVEADGPSWRAELVSLAYDHEASAVRAEAGGRPEWAHALRTGFMPPAEPAR